MNPDTMELVYPAEKDSSTNALVGINELFMILRLRLSNNQMANQPWTQRKGDLVRCCHGVYSFKHTRGKKSTAVAVEFDLNEDLLHWIPKK